MNREYKVSTGYKIFYLLCAATIIAFGIFLLVVRPRDNSGLFVFAALTLFAGSAIALSVFRGRIIVTDHSIVRINLIKTKEILFTDIKGFRIDNKAIRVLPVYAHTAKLSIANYTDYGQINEFTEWLDATFVNLDNADFLESAQQLMADADLGPTENDRQRKLRSAGYLAYAYNTGGAILLLASVLLRQSGWIDIFLVLYPLLTIPVMLMSKGLIKFFFKRNSPYFNVFLGLAFSAIGLFIKAFLGFEKTGIGNGWIYIVMVSLLFTATLKWADSIRKTVVEKGSIILLLVNGFFVGYGSVIVVNCRLDKSAETVYYATVIDSYINHSSGTHPYIKISQWGAQTQIKEIQVSMDLYNQSPIGSAVTIHLKKGALNIPWYTISR